MVHMRTANSMAMLDGGNGMEHLREYRAAADGKRHGNRASQKASALGFARRLIFAAAALLIASMWGSSSYAQSGPFAGMAGNWSGAGTVTLDDGSTERIRCRAAYAVGAGGNGLQQTLTCASDSYKFNIVTNVIAQGAAVSGTWSETSRNINGAIEGRSGGGNFQVVATAPGFSAAISLTTRGNKQSVVIKAETQFRGVNISMSRS
jgi:hypothetical protein